MRIARSSSSPAAAALWSYQSTASSSSISETIARCRSTACGPSFAASSWSLSLDIGVPWLIANSNEAAEEIGVARCSPSTDLRILPGPGSEPATLRRPGSAPGDLARDQQALDVTGALVDLAHPHVAVDPLDRKIGEIAIAAMDLDRVRGDPLGHLGGEQFGHRRLLEAGLAIVAALSCVEDKTARGSELRRHVGEAERDRLVRHELLPERLAFLGIGERRLISGAGHPECLRGDADAPAFEVGQGDPVALALAAEHQIGGQLHLLEDKLGGVGGALAELLLEPRDAIARRRRRHDKGADTLAPGGGVGDREDDRHVRALPRGDELLGAVDHPAIAVAPGAGLD